MAIRIRVKQVGEETILRTGGIDHVVAVPEGHIDAALLIARLEDAGATLLALPHMGHSTRMRQMRFDIVHTALEAYGWAAPSVRAPVPDAAAISAMDAAFGWLALIPDEKFVLRRIIGARALVHPLTRRHLYPWRRLAGLLGADHKSVQRWHTDGLMLMVGALVAHACAGSSAMGRVQPVKKISRQACFSPLG